MLVQQKKFVTLEEFEAFIHLPENAEKSFELIGGEIAEVPSNPLSSHIGSRVNRRVAAFVEDNDLGYTTSADGGYRVMGEPYIPDVAFISKARYPEELPYYGDYLPIAPDLAIEIILPANTERLMMIKVANYLAAGTTAWLFYPLEQQVHVYAPGQAVKILDRNGTLEGGTVLPGFTLALAEIFPAKEPE